MNSVEKYIDEKVKASQDFDFQSLKMVAYHKGQVLVRRQWGKPYDFYDLASLTKIIFTTVWFMEAYHYDHKILLTKVKDILPWYQHDQVRIGQLLNHSAGNQWWQPFYKDINLSLAPEQAYQQMESFCRKAPLSRSDKSLYSDIDFYLLGSIMQKKEGQPLHLIWQRIKNKFYDKTNLHFNYGNKPHYLTSRYAPTEKCPWRKKIMRGQVHDENCWALGGMAPHAGLFGGIDDLAHYGLLIRKAFLGKNKAIAQQDIKKFCRRSMSTEKGDWGYGFMLPSPKGSSSGERFNKDSFGHTGFTGTSFWFDGRRDLFVGLLSNRVYPSRNNKGFQRLRPQMHDWLIEELEGVK